jgi:enediyne polyketide synthase
MSSKGIAIVGMDCRFPGSNNLTEYWENILSMRQEFRRIPDMRLDLRDYYSNSRLDLDSTYSTQAAVLTGWHFDRIKHKVPKDTFDQTDLSHWLALEVAGGALRDAGFSNGEGLDRTRVGTIFGNSLTGEFSRSYLMRLRWPFVQRILNSVLHDSIPSSGIDAILSQVEAEYKSMFSPPTADTLAGGLSNTIAGRICNYFNFNGCGYTVDGACSSSLLAVVHGCKALTDGDLDLALVGGVDLSIDPFEIIGFARNGALAEREMRVFDARSEGFWPGEGCGAMALMREEEAAAKGLRTYAVIRGWGMSSDGSGGMTRPKSETQRLAMQRAYAKAGYGIDTIAYFEGHGTGTPVGDAEELSALIAELSLSPRSNHPAKLGSVKNLIGHTKAAAGAAGTIKAALALQHRILPGMRGDRQPHPLLEQTERTLKISEFSESWNGNGIMRASVSGMGFGGINAHITLEASRHSSPTTREKLNTMTLSAWDAELFVFGAATKEDLIAEIDTMRPSAQAMSRSEMSDCAKMLSGQMTANSRWRAAIVVSKPEEFQHSLEKMSRILTEGKNEIFDAQSRIFVGGPDSKKKIGFLFPGQGAPVYKSPGALGRFLGDIQLRYSTLPKMEDLRNTEVMQPSIMASSLAAMELLARFGLEGEIAVGHSLGEIAAMSWVGLMDGDTAQTIAIKRGQILAQFGEKDTGLMVLGCSADEAQHWMDGPGMHIACDNGQKQCVVGGRLEAIEAMRERLVEAGIPATPLKVSKAFHTPAMAPASNAFESFLDSILTKPSNSILRRVQVSTITGLALDKSDWRPLLVNQLTREVKFREAFKETDGKADFFIEVGPGAALTRLLNDENNFTSIPLDFGGSSIQGFLTAMGAAYSAGAPVDIALVFEGRFNRPFNVEKIKDVLINPCEQGVKGNLSSRKPKTEVQSKKIQESQESNILAVPSEKPATASRENILSELVRLVALRLEMPESIINPTDRVLSGLHLNSLAITDVVAKVSKHFGKSHQAFSAASVLAGSDATLAALAEVLSLGTDASSPGVGVQSHPDAKWVFPFVETWVPKSKTKHGKNFAAQKIETDIKRYFDSGLGSWGERLDRLLSALASAKLSGVKRFELIENYKLAMPSLSPIVRTFHLENPGINYRILGVEAQPEAELSPNDELGMRSTRVAELRMDGEQILERVFVPWIPDAEMASNHLQANDVLLVTGGGKGITFVSAKSIAQEFGVRLAIVGRSLPAEDRVLSDNLAELKATGLEFIYVNADVSNPDALEKAISRIRNEFGEPTAFIHGAGINRPKSLHQLVRKDFEESYKIKAEGFRNVLATLDGGKNLKVVIAYSSIIARSGMLGNADYAFANESLSCEVETFKAKNKNCLALSLEWSVWDETGMGVELGTLDRLKAMGVFPIPVKTGLGILSAILKQAEAPPVRLTVTGRYGNLPTFPFQKGKTPFSRFLSDTLRYLPGISIIGKASLSLIDDPYLSHHVFKGQSVFPTVLALEAMAQAGEALICNSIKPEFLNLEITRPIIIPQKGNTKILVIGERLTQNKVKVELYLEEEIVTPCFVSILNYGSETMEMNLMEKETAPLDLDVNAHFYDDLLFHTGPFRRIQSFSLIDGWSSVSSAKVQDRFNWFHASHPKNLILGDPGLHDAAIHAHQACRPHYNLLPSGCEKISFHKDTIEGEYRIFTKETHSVGRDIFISVEVYDSTSERVMTWSGLKMTPVAGTRFNGEWQSQLLIPYLQHTAEKHLGIKASIFVHSGELPQEFNIEPAISHSSNTISALLKPMTDGETGNGEWLIDSDREKVSGSVKVAGLGWVKIILAMTSTIHEGKI